MLIGSVGSHLSTLCRLALHVADIPIHKMDTSKQSNFFDGLRSAVRLSGAENKILTVVFTVSTYLMINKIYIHVHTNNVENFCLNYE